MRGISLNGIGGRLGRWIAERLHIVLRLASNAAEGVGCDRRKKLDALPGSAGSRRWRRGGFRFDEQNGFVAETGEPSERNRRRRLVRARLMRFDFYYCVPQICC
jgi:hypothetical protein